MDVHDVGAALWRQRALVVLVWVVTGTAVGAGILLAPKSYTATATIGAAVRPSATDAQDADGLRATLAELANSRGVVDLVRARITTDRSAAQLRRSIRGDWVRGTTLIDITVEDRSPDAAAEIADTVAAVLVDGAALPAVGPTLDRTLDLRVSDPAAVPDSYSSPDRRLAAALGVLAALGLATAAAVLRDRRTRTADDAASIEGATAAPLLAHLDPPADMRAMPALTPGTADAGLFRHLRLAAETDGGSSLVVVAGVADGNVVVWIGANLALALAGSGRRVLLVDGRMGARFGVPVEEAPDTPGLYDVLRGVDLSAAVSPGPMERLQVLPAGTYGDDPVPDLIAARFATVMQAAAEEFDHVVVIGPPLEASDDSRAMAVDASIVLAIVEASVSTSALRAHAARIRAAGARLLGVVLVARVHRTAA